MLEHDLGFIRNDEEVPPEDKAPKTLKRNERGLVVGHVFEFKWEALLDFADWIESFTGTVTGKALTSSLRIDLPLITRFKIDAAAALRDLGKKRKKT